MAIPPKRNPRFPPGEYGLKPGKLTVDQLDGRYKCLVKHAQKVVTVVLCPTQLSPSRMYIKIGQFYHDEVSGWCEVSSIEVVEVLKQIHVELVQKDGVFVQVRDPDPTPWAPVAFLGIIAVGAVALAVWTLL